MEIKKASIKNRQIKFTYETTKNDDTTDTIIHSSDALVHQDMLDTFKKLAFHMAHLSDLKEIRLLPKKPDAFLDVAEEHFSHLEVTGFTLGGNGENEGVSLTGTKVFKGKVLNITVPFTQFSKETEEYKHLEDLQLSIQHCIHEIEEFINGKVAFKQTEMFEEEKELTENMDMTISHKGKTVNTNTEEIRKIAASPVG